MFLIPFIYTYYVVTDEDVREFKIRFDHNKTLPFTWNRIHRKESCKASRLRRWLIYLGCKRWLGTRIYELIGICATSFIWWNIFPVVKMRWILSVTFYFYDFRNSNCIYGTFAPTSMVQLLQFTFYFRNSNNSNCICSDF